MHIEINVKACELLERIANSMYDRFPDNPNPLVFSVSEIHLVERWIEELIKDIRKPDSV